jgi:hypothetical protein
VAAEAADGVASAVKPSVAAKVAEAASLRKVVGVRYI